MADEPDPKLDALRRKLREMKGRLLEAEALALAGLQAAPVSAPPVAGPPPLPSMTPVVPSSSVPSPPPPDPLGPRPTPFVPPAGLFAPGAFPTPPLSPQPYPDALPAFPDALPAPPPLPPPLPGAPALPSLPPRESVFAPAALAGLPPLTVGGSSPQPPQAVGAPPPQSPASGQGDGTSFGRMVALLEQILRAVEKMGQGGQGSGMSQTPGGVLLWQSSATPFGEVGEGYPTASPSVNTSSLAGLRGAGGWGFGSRFPRGKEGQADFLEPTRRRPG